MVKKKKGGKGGKKKRRGKKAIIPGENRKVVTRGEGEQYARAVKMLGDRRVLADVYDNKTKCWSEKMVHVPGKFRKRVWVNVDNYLLVSERSFETGTLQAKKKKPIAEHGGDIIHVYQDNEVRRLIRMKEFKPKEQDSDSDDERQDNACKIGFINSSEEDAVESDGESKPKRIPIAPQRTRAGMLPSSSSDEEDYDKMNSDELRDALDDL
jgi:translation initiation factor 1A